MPPSPAATGRADSRFLPGERNHAARRSTVS